jgi:HYR domain/Ricin-type beta-trefoil lectin domain-like/Secretion system C-terminal sorting domain
MTKLLRFNAMLFVCFLAFFSTPILGQTGTSPCLGDTMKPFFERCPQNIVTTTPDSCTPVHWNTPLAFDNCGIYVLIGSHQLGDCFPQGTTLVNFLAVDSSNNKSLCSFSVTVNRPALDTSYCATDTIKPYFLNCPVNSVWTTSDSCKQIEWAPILAYDNCASPSVAGTHESGSCFPMGQTFVSYYATDARGNIARCAFMVTILRPVADSAVCVIDTIKPVFTLCPPNITEFVTNNSSTCAVARWLRPLATDNCSAPSVVGVYPASQCFPEGTTPVVYTATDAKGNKATCTFTISVIRIIADTFCLVDTIKPYFTSCPTSQTFVAYDTCMRVQWPTPIAQDNCMTPTVVGSHTSGACFPVGNTPVTYTATDTKGNAATCLFTISVVRISVDTFCVTDTVKPRFTFCPPSQTLTLTPSATGITDTCMRTQWASPVAVDNCGIPTVISSHSPVNIPCFKVGTTPVVYTATDAKGNKSVCSFSITVIRPVIDPTCQGDTIKPQFISCPVSQTFVAYDTCMRVQWATPIAIDNCGTPTVVGNHTSGACLPIGNTPVTYTATDTKGNKATCSFTISVIRIIADTFCVTDTTKPRFTFCPSNITVSGLDTCSRVQWTTPIATDNCSTPVLSSNYTSGTCFKAGATGVVYSATDAKGNVAICTFVVYVSNPCTFDTIKPRFAICPSNIRVTSADTCARITFNTPTATDNCSVPRVIGNYQSGECFRPGTTNVVYTAIDSKGNSSVCSFAITVVSPCASDSIRPVFTVCPQNITVTSLDTCSRVTFNTPLATDNCSTPQVVGNYQAGACFKTGTTGVVYTATDAKGNSSICSFTVTVVNPCATDTVKPRFVLCPPNITITSLDTCGRVQWTNPIVTDNCSTPSVKSTYKSTDCFKAGTTSVVYTATDAKGNSSICSFTVTVVNPCATDTVKPRFVLCPQNITVTSLDTCSRVTFNTPLATDNCSTPQVVGNYQAGACFKTGTTGVVYTATDAKGNSSICSFTVTVVNPCATDTVKPRFVLCPPNITITSLDTCGRVQWTNPIATDNCSTPSVTSTYKSTDCFKAGTTSVVYTATDAKGNSSTCSFSVTVVNPCATDTTKPRFILCPQNITLTSLDTCARVTFNTPLATDNCSTPRVVGNYAAGACFKTGSTGVVYTATDAKGNSSTCSFTVTVVNPCATDTIKPRFILCPTNITVTSLDTCAKVTFNTPLATDNCSTPRIVGNYTSGTCFKTGTTGVVYTATDSKGNSSICSFTVTVVNPCATDTIKPRIAACPSNIVVSSLDTCVRVQWNAPSATDNCSIPKVTSNYTSGTCIKTGTTTVVYTATDAKGNSSTCSFTVTVKNPCTNDTIKPTYYNCPANIVKETGDTTAKITWSLPIAIDNCAVKTLTQSHQSGSIFKIGVTTVTYTATDAAGNRAYCSFTVTVKQVLTPCSTDSVPPVFTNCPANISLSTAATTAIAQWTKPTATDNCSTPSVTSTVNSGASFPIGTTAVVYTAKDAKGNVTFCTFSVVVTKQPLVIDSTKCYVLVARSSKKAASIAYASTAGAADAVQWTYAGGLNQKWGITKADSNSVNLTVKHTNMNLDTRWGTTANGSKLMQWTKSTGLTQKWQLIPLSDGYFKVVNKASGRALSVNGGTTATTDGSLLVQLDYAGLTSQQWSIEAVSCGGNPTSNFTTNDVLDANAKAEAHRARIEWVDNTGYKNDYYEVEKLNTTSGKFESMSIINNTKFDDQLTSQTAYDNEPTEGDNFYRVKVAYLDSVTKVSPVLKVNFNDVNAVKVFPNPASDFVDIDLTTYSAGTVNIHLYNSFGQEVAAQTVEKGKTSIVHLDITNQQSGNYMIRITAQGKRDVTKQLHIIR